MEFNAVLFLCFRDSIAHVTDSDTRGCLKKKWTDILISAAKTTIPRVKVHFRWSKLCLQKINSRYCTRLCLKNFRRCDDKCEKIIFQKIAFL